MKKYFITLQEIYNKNIIIQSYEKVFIIEYSFSTLIITVTHRQRPKISLCISIGIQLTILY